jgi:hypothetical protein
MRRTELWSYSDRRERQLLRSDDMLPAVRRSYRVVHAKDADGALRCYLFARAGAADERRIGTVELTGNLAPSELSMGSKVLLYPPLALLDLYLWAVGIVFAPIVIPLSCAGGRGPID